MVFVIEAVLFTAITVFAALGLCDIIHIIRAAFLMPDVKPKSFTVLFLKRGHAADQLRCFSEKLRWYGGEFCDGIAAITDELDSIETATCERYCYGSDIRLMTSENISALLDGFGIGETDEKQYDGG